MNDFVPLVVEDFQGNFQHYSIVGEGECTPKQLLDALGESNVSVSEWMLNGQVLTNFQTINYGAQSTGFVLQHFRNSSPWLKLPKLEIMAGPDSGKIIDFPSEINLSKVVSDPLIPENLLLTKQEDTTYLNSRNLQIHLDNPVAVGSSVVLVKAKKNASKIRKIYSPIELGQNFKIPSTQYRFYLLLAFVPLLIALGLLTFTGHWYFLLFAAMGLVGGLIPYTQGRNAYVSFIKTMKDKTQEAVFLHKHAILYKAVQPPTSTLLLCLGFGDQEIPLVMPDKSRPKSQQFVPIGITLSWIDQNFASEEMNVSNHTLQRGRFLWVEAASHQHECLFLNVLEQIIDVHGSNPILITLGKPLADSQKLLSTWLRFFPTINLVLSNNSESRIVVSSLSCVPVQGKESSYEVIFASSKPPLKNYSWCWQVNTHQLFFHTPKSQSAPVLVRNPRFMSVETFAERLTQQIKTQADNTGSWKSVSQLPLRQETSQCSLAATIGITTMEEKTRRCTIDLVTDGPHMLVVGTTGSGKSVLLRRLISEWCARYSPDRLNLILVDFKGGSTFAPFLAMPHVTAQLNDLEAKNTSRLLVSIRTEIRRRELLFQQAGVTDFSEYQASNSSVLARIAVVIDEYAVLASEEPAALDELIYLATVGRSLGFHLILATQNAGAGLTPAIKNNIGIRISLRVTQAQESLELLGIPLAAQILASQPGHGFMLRAGEDPLAFKTLLYSESSELKIVSWPNKTTSSTTKKDSWNKILERIEGYGSACPSTPILLPPLPEKLSINDVRVLGRIDDPTHVLQEDVLWPCASSNYLGKSLIVFGKLGTKLVIDRVLNVLNAETSIRDAPHPQNIFLLSTDQDVRLPKTIGGLAYLQEPHFGFELLAHLLGAEGRFLDEPSLLIIQDLDRWFERAEEYRFYQFEGLLRDLFASSQRTDSHLSILLTSSEVQATHKFLSYSNNQLYLPYGISIHDQLLWPVQKMADNEVITRGILMGEGLSDQGLIFQTAFAKTPKKNSVPERQALLGALPAIYRINKLPTSTAKVVIGVSGLDHHEIHLNKARHLVIVGTDKSGKSNLCNVIKHQLEEDAIVVDDIGKLDARELKALSDAVQSNAEMRIICSLSPPHLQMPSLQFLLRNLLPENFVLLRPQSREHFSCFGMLPPGQLQRLPGRGYFVKDSQLKLFQAATFGQE